MTSHDSQLFLAIRLATRRNSLTLHAAILVANQTLVLCVALIALSIPLVAKSSSRPTQTSDYLFNDTHFHLTNYIQEGTDIHAFLGIMGNKVGRVALFGIPLQQQWSFRVDGDRGPTYYLNSDAPLYYYSFTDA